MDHGDASSTPDAEWRYRALLEACSDGLWELNATTGALWFSPRWKAQLGFRDDDLPNEFATFAGRLHPADVDPVLASLTAFENASGSRWEATYRLAHADGGYRQMRTRATGERDDEGLLVRLLGVQTDETDQLEAIAEIERLQSNLAVRAADRDREGDETRRTAERLRAQEDLSRAVLDTAQVIILVLDTEARIVAFNRYMESLSGWTIDEVVGRDWFDAFLPEADHEEIRAVFQRSIRDQRTHGQVNPIRTRDGELRYIAWYDQVVRDANGEVLHVVAAGHDVTEQRAVRQALEASEMRFRSSFEQGLVGMAILDGDLRWLEVNDELRRIFGDAPREPLRWPRGWLYRVHDSDRSREREAQANLLSEKVDTYSHTLRWDRADGSVTHVKLTVRRLRHSEHGTHALHLLVDDVTDRHRAEDELRRLAETLEARVEARTQELRAAQTAMLQSEKLASIGTLVGGVAHEINNPLMGLFNYVDFARTNPEDPETGHFLELAEKELERIRDIVSNMTSFTRRAPSSPSEVNLEAPLERALELLAADFRHRNITVERRFEAAPARVSTPDMQQVFLNLLLNAKDAMCADEDTTSPALRCRTGVHDDVAWAEIEDCGPGVPADLESRIFDPFFTTKPAGLGTGLGLSVAHQVVLSSGGTLGVRSAAPRGAVFRIEVPAAAGGSDEHRPAEEPSEA